MLIPTIVATGRGDFPNQINNSLVFPGVFRGMLDARSRGVNFGIMVKAAQEMKDKSEFTESLNQETIIMKVDEVDINKISIAQYDAYCGDLFAENNVPVKFYIG